MLVWLAHTCKKSTRDSDSTVKDCYFENRMVTYFKLIGTFQPDGISHGKSVVRGEIYDAVNIYCEINRCSLLIIIFKAKQKLIDTNLSVLSFFLKIRTK